MGSKPAVTNGNHMRALIGLAVVAIAACAAPSEIVKTGPTTYRVRTDAGGGNPSDAEIKTRGSLGALKGRVVRKLAAGDVEEEDLDHERAASRGGAKRASPRR